MNTLALKILDTVLASVQHVAEGLAKVVVTPGNAVQGSHFARRDSDLTYPGSSANIIHRNDNR